MKKFLVATIPFLSPERSLKPKPEAPGAFLAILALMAALAVPARAANITKAGSGTDLTAGASWADGTAPAGNDIAIWDTGSLGTGLSLNSSTPNWSGIQITAGASDPVNIGSSGTLTLGAGGIDMSASTINATIGSGLTLAAGNQFWNLKSPGRTLTASGTFTRSAGATLFASTNAAGGIGTITFAPALLNSILPWAVMTNSGASANNSAAGYTFATVAGGNLVAYTSATPEVTTASAWGGISSGGSGTVNYDISIAGTPGQTGLGRNVNSLRYTGTGMNQQGNNTGILLNANGIMNSGTGTFTLASGGSLYGITPSSTTANELVLVAASANIDIYAYIANNVNPGKVTIVGPNTVILRNTGNTYTGGTVINSGTLSLAGGGGSGAIRGTLTINPGAQVQLNATDALGYGTGTCVTNIIITGGTLNDNVAGNNGYRASWTLTGGTMSSTGGGSFHIRPDEGWSITSLASPVTSTISGSVVLREAAASLPINVADGAVATDLLISGGISEQNTGAKGITKMGAGTLVLSGTNTYTGATVVSNGVLAISGSGSLVSSNILVVSPGNFDVSAVTYTLASGRTLAGSGAVVGNVATAGGSAITPGGINVGDVGTLTFANNLDLSAGGSATFDLSSTSGSGNDQVAVTGSLTLSSSDAIHINPFNGSLDTADYVLFAVATGATMSTTPVLIWDGFISNEANYSLQKSGNNIVLHYSTATAPSVTYAYVNPGAVFRNQTVTITANVTSGSGSVTNVTVDLTQIGGSGTAGLVQDSSQLPSLVYTNTFTVAASTTLGDKSLTVTAKDNTSPTPLTGSYVITPLTIGANIATWDGGGADDKWSSTTNWTSDTGPGFIGDSVTFSGSVRLTPDMDTNYSVTGVTFDGSASAFTIGSSTGSVLTNSGGIINYSSSEQTLNVPVVLSAAQTFNNASSGNLTVNSNLNLGANLLTLDGGASIAIGGVVSGSAGLTKNGGGSLVLSNANTFTGTVNISAGTVVLANANAAANNTFNFTANSTGTLDIQSDSDNVAVTNIQSSSGSGSSWTFASDRATSGAGINHTIGPVALAQATLNVTAGPNVSGGSPKITTGAMNLSSGLSANVTINPTSADIAIASMTSASINKSLALDGTSAGNEIVGTIDNAKVITITKQNSGTWKLSGTNTFTGGVNLNAGTLIANAPAALGASGTISFGGGTLQYGAGWNTTDYSSRFSAAASQVYNLDVNGKNVTYASALTSSGGTLTLTDTAGGGSLTLAGANTYTGNTSVNAGKLLSATTGSSASAITVASGATNGVLLAGLNGTWTNSSSVTQNSGSALVIDFQNFAPGTNVAPMNVSTLTVNPSVALVVKGVAGNFTVGQTNPLIAWTSGPADASAFSLVMPNRVTGHLLVSGNTLNLVVDAYTGPISWNTGNGTWNTSTPNWVDALLAPATFVDGGDAVVFGDASGVTGNPAVTLNSALTPVSVTMNSASHNYTLNGTGGIIGNGSLAVQNGTLTLATTNAYTGGTTVGGGTLQISGDGTMGASTGALTVLGGTVDLGTTSRTKGAVTIAGGTITNGILSGTSFAATNAGAVTLSAALSGTGALTKNGNGLLTLSGTNNYTGGTTVANGSLALSGNGTLGATNNALTISGGTLDLGGLTTASAGAVTFSGGTVSNGTLTAYNSYTANSTGGSTVSANLAGAVALAKTGAGTLTLSGANNTYSGGTSIGIDGAGTRIGVIRATTTGALGTGTINIGPGGNDETARLELAGGILLTNAITHNARNNASAGIENISGNNTLSGAISIDVGGSGIYIQSDAGTLTIGTASATAISAISGARVVTLQGAGNGNVVGAINPGGGSIALVKDGAGIWTLSSPNFYSGTTTVSGGTLLVNGSTSLGAVTVNGGALGGTGAIGGAVAVNSGGTLAPGMSIGTLTINGNVTLNAGSTNTFEVDGGGAHDLIALGGSANAAYGGVLNIVPSGSFTAGQQFQLFSGTGATNASNFASIVGSPGSGKAFSFTNGVLSVVSAGPGGPGVITNSFSGGVLTLTWPAGQGWTLEGQTNNLSTGLNPAAWYPVSASDGSFSTTVNPTNPAVFYRLKY